jgi:hypothetical protein
MTRTIRFRPHQPQNLRPEHHQLNGRIGKDHPDQRLMRVTMGRPRAGFLDGTIRSGAGKCLAPEHLNKASVASR